MNNLIRLIIVIVFLSIISACGGNSSDSTINSSSSSLLVQNSPNAYSPSIAMMADGKAIAVWSEGTSSQSLWVNYYNPNTGWGAAQSVGSGTGNEGGAEIAVNASGSAALIWTRTINNTNEILAANYDPSNGWSTASVLDATGFGLNPTIAMDDDGNATALWHRTDFVNHSYMNTIMTSRYTSTGWEVPQILESTASTPMHSLSGNSAGKEIAIWNQAEPDLNQPGYHNYNTYVRIFTPGIGWSSSQTVGNAISELDGSGYYNPTTTPGHYYPMVSINEQGDALALWSEVDYAGNDYRITVNQFNMVNGWGAPLSIGNISASSSITVSPFVLDGSDTAYVSVLDSWYNYSYSLSNIHVAAYKSGTGWTFTKVLDSQPYYFSSPLITVGKSGNLYLTWKQYGNNSVELWSKKYSPLSGWENSIRLDKNSGTVTGYKAARDALGNVLVIWTQNSGTDPGVWAKLIK
ncbi:MAG: hypothetical protein GJT30_17705 [Geobacter sp.]|nr:hypothetical protein [Geobacter sp.]